MVTELAPPGRQSFARPAEASVPNPAITRSKPTEPTRSTHRKPKISEFRAIPTGASDGNLDCNLPPTRTLQAQLKAAGAGHRVTASQGGGPCQRRSARRAHFNTSNSTTKRQGDNEGRTVADY